MLRDITYRIFKLLSNLDLNRKKIISPCVIYCNPYNLWLSCITAITADHYIQPSAIICNADHKPIIHGKLTVMLLPGPVTLVYLLSTLGVIVRVFVHEMV